MDKGTTSQKNENVRLEMFTPPWKYNIQSGVIIALSQRHGSSSARARPHAIFVYFVSLCLYRSVNLLQITDNTPLTASLALRAHCYSIISLFPDNIPREVCFSTENKIFCLGCSMSLNWNNCFTNLYNISSSRTFLCICFHIVLFAIFLETAFAPLYTKTSAQGPPGEILNVCFIVIYFVSSGEKYPYLSIFMYQNSLSKVFEKRQRQRTTDT